MRLSAFKAKVVLTSVRASDYDDLSCEVRYVVGGEFSLRGIAFVDERCYDTHDGFVGEGDLVKSGRVFYAGRQESKKRGRILILLDPRFYQHPDGL